MCRYLSRGAVAGLLMLSTLGCASTPPDTDSKAAALSDDVDAETPPPAIQAWMDRLTVEHSYDPETGFIVAREIIELPAVIADGAELRDAIDRGRDEAMLLVVFTTADRCAPCQQYKKSALNDARVIHELSQSDILVTHVEVDREPELAEELLGSLGIPMTYAFRDGVRVATLRGQRSAEELLVWLAEQQSLGGSGEG